MNQEIRKAKRVKMIVEQLMQEKVYQGDVTKPQIKPDVNGAFNFSDRKVQISCKPSPREGFLNCALTVRLIRRRFPFRKLETVMETGYGVEFYTFRPGMWIEYIAELTKTADSVAEEREAQKKQRQEEGEKQALEDNFSPVDDSALFTKW